MTIGWIHFNTYPPKKSNTLQTVHYILGGFIPNDFSRVSLSLDNWSDFGWMSLAYNSHINLGIVCLGPMFLVYSPTNLLGTP